MRTTAATTTPTAKAESATTEKKLRDGRKNHVKKYVPRVTTKVLTSIDSESNINSEPNAQTSTNQEIEMNANVQVLNANTAAKFVLFNIPANERVSEGPVMRGFVEIEGEGDAEPVKVNCAAWQKTGRENGTPYLSLKIGNNTKEQPDVYTVGPFFGRLFREVEQKAAGEKIRYFGFIEDSERTGEDKATGRGIYKTNWQLRINAKRAKSGDGKTIYVNGAVAPSNEASDHSDDLPF